MKKTKLALSTTQIILLSFLTTILLGSLLLSLPVSSADGVAVPSNDDVATTRLICRTLGALNIRVVDHIIVGDNDFVSLADSGKI